MNANCFSIIPWMIVLMAMGCGGTSDRPELGQVTGTVTLDGTPLPNVKLYFWPKAGGRTSVAFTDEAGKYDMIYLSGVNGVKLGECEIRVTTQDDEDGRSISKKDIRSKIPRRYKDEAQFTYEVVPGSQVYDIELTTES